MRDSGERMRDNSGHVSDPLDAAEEKWRTTPADLAEWANRATWALGLARKWKHNALEWERLARKEADRGA